MSTDILHIQMVGIQSSVSGCLIKSVITEPSPTDNQRTDAEVQRGVLCGVFGCQGVEGKLIIGGRVRIFLVERSLYSE